MAKQRFFMSFLAFIFMMFSVSLAFGEWVEIGSGTDTENYVPCYGYYDFSWSEVVYLQSEIGDAIDINGISYNVGNTPTSYTMPGQKIYMKLTADTSFPDGSYPDPTNNGYTLVYDGDVTWDGAGWHQIDLDTPFSYDGTSNLLICWENYDGDWDSGYPTFLYTAQTDRAKYKYQDGSFPALDGTLSNYAANIRLHYQGTLPPSTPYDPSPPDMAENVIETPLLSWSSDFAETYDVYFDGTLIADDIDSTTYQVDPPLDFDTTYQWYVIATNVNGSTTGPTWSFTTRPDPYQPIPYSQTFSDTTLPVEYNYETHAESNIRWSADANYATREEGGMVMEGGGSGSWSTPDEFTVWQDAAEGGDNYEHSAMTTMYFNGTATYMLEFDYYMVYQYNDFYTNMRIDVKDGDGNWIQVGEDFRPNGENVPWTHAQVDLGNITSGSFAVRFWTNCKYDIEDGEGNGVYIDNISVEEKLPYDVVVTEPPMGQVEMGDFYDYELEIANIGSNDDTYDLTVSASSWTYQILDKDNFTDITQIAIPAGMVDTVIVRVTPTESRDEYSDTVMFTATSQGDPMIYDEVPITTEAYSPYAYLEENFDESEELPLGWNTIVETTSEYPYVEVSTSNPRSEPHCVKFYNSSDISAVLMLVTPSLDETISQYRLTFWLRGLEGQPMVVGTLTDPMDATTFAPVDTFVVEASNFYQRCVEVIQTPGSEPFYVGFKHGQDDSYDSYYVDDVTIEEQLPYDVEATQMTPDATIPLGSTYDYEVEILNAGSNDDTYSLDFMNIGMWTYEIRDKNMNEIEDITIAAGETDTVIVHVMAEYPGSMLYDTETLTITSQADNTIYDEASFTTTGYAPYTSLFEDFDGAEEFPFGWTSYINSTSSYATVEVQTSDPHSEPNCVRLYNSSDDEADLFLISPALSSDVVEYTVSYWAKSSSGEQNLPVGYMTDPQDPMTFVAIDTALVSADYDSLRQLTIMPSDDNIYLAFKHGLDGTYDTYYIDDITVEEEVEEGTATDILISEYIEGSSHNKAIEIFNGTGSDVDLSIYSLEKDVNGDGNFGNTYNYSGMLANGDVFVLANSQADSLILEVADDTDGVINFNGDDQVRLLKAGVEIDRIGVSGDVSFGQNVTYVRDSTVASPLSGEQDPRYNGQWIEYPQDTFDYLGEHVFAGGGGENLPPQITDASTVPAIPTSSYDINITADITDADGDVMSAMLYWGLVSDSLPNEINMSQIDLDTYMTDSAIPAQPGGTVVYYQIEATDDMGDTGMTSVLDYAVVEELTIYDIQSTVDTTGASLYEGALVMTTGIITYAEDNGYFLQDGSGAWNGIYVYDYITDAVIGDEVTLVGEVDEYYGYTELKNIDSYVVNTSGNALPELTMITTGDFGEPYEGVLVEVENATCTDADMGFGEWEVDDGTGPCVVDDRYYAYTPTEGVSYNVAGLGYYSYGAFKLEPRDANDVSEYEPYAAIHVEPQSLSEALAPGEMVTDTLMVYNQGADTLIIENVYNDIDTGAVWLTQMIASNVILPGTDTELWVTFDATALDVGDYFANIYIESNDPDPEDSTYVIDASLYVETINPPENLMATSYQDGVVPLEWDEPEGGMEQETVILWDQIDPEGETYGKAAQDFEASLDAYDCEVSGDFVLSQQATLTGFKAIGHYSSSVNPMDSFPFNIAIYPDLGGYPDETALYTSTTSAAVRDSNTGIWDVILDAPITLDAGTYWVGYQIVMDFSTAGQGYMRMRVTHNNGTVGYWRNPGDGFGTGYTMWTADVVNGDDAPRDLAFQLLGYYGAASTSRNITSDVETRTRKDTSPVSIVRRTPTMESEGTINRRVDYSSIPIKSGSRALQGYNVYRKEEGGYYSDPIAFTTDLYYDDMDVVNGTEYYYQVTATYMGGESVPSNEASAMPGLPEITLNPVSVEDSVMWQNTEMIPVVIQNSGDADLEWYIPQVLYTDWEGDGSQEFTDFNWMAWDDPETPSNDWILTDHYSYGWVAKFNWSPSVTDYSEWLTTIVDCSDLTEVYWSFWHYFDNFSGSGNTVSAKLSTDGGITWTEIWSHSGSDKGPETLTFDITEYAAGESEVMLSFNIYGDNSYNINGWYVDNILVSSNQWLTFEPGQGMLEPGQADTVMLTLDATNASNGTYTETLVFEDMNEAATPMALPVTMNVYGGYPIIDVSVDEYIEECEVGAMLERTFELDNIGGDVLNFTIVNEYGDTMSASRGMRSLSRDAIQVTTSRKQKEKVAVNRQMPRKPSEVTFNSREAMDALVWNPATDYTTGDYFNTWLTNEGWNVVYETGTDLSSYTLSDYDIILISLGIYGNGNYQLDEANASLVATYLDQGGKLYMEGGDTWYWDTQTTLHPYFHIDALSDGSGDLDQVDGVSGTYAEGMSYAYGGANNWIDRILSDGTDGAFNTWERTGYYTCGVSYDGDYQTVGTSFQFGGLGDGPDDAMSAMMSFFGLTDYSALVWNPATDYTTGDFFNTWLTDQGWDVTYDTGTDISGYTLASYDAIFVALGIFGNGNYELDETNAAMLAAYLDQGGNLYMEGGDTWYWDTQTTLHPYFHIDALSDGNSDLTQVDGVSGTYADGLSYAYLGDNSWIDQITTDGTDGAFNTWENIAEGYYCGVSYEDTYKTVGTSFQFGGLGESPGEAMYAMIEFFGFEIAPEFVPWLSEDPNTGTLMAQDPPVVVTVTMDATELAPDEYMAQIIISGDGAESVTIPVTLTVNPKNPPMNLAMDPSSDYYYNGYGDHAIPLMWDAPDGFDPLLANRDNPFEISKKLQADSKNGKSRSRKMVSSRKEEVLPGKEAPPVEISDWIELSEPITYAELKARCESNYGGSGRALMHYNLYRGEESGTYTEYTTMLTDESYVDHEVVLGDTLYYVVTSFYSDGAGESDYSEEVEAIVGHPEIYVESDIYTTAYVGDPTSEVIMIDNTAGTATLEIYAVGNEDNTQADEYGYEVYDNHDGVTFDWMDISTMGTLVDSMFDSGDDGVVTVDLPFDFEFYGVAYNEITISTNGWIGFGEISSSYYSNYSMPYDFYGNTVPIVAPLWDDLKLGTEEGGYGSIYYYYDATNEQFIIQYDEVAHFSAPDAHETFQIILEPRYYYSELIDGDITYQYSDVELTAINSATVGIQNETGTIGLEYVYNNDYAFGAIPIVDGTAIKFMNGTNARVGEYDWMDIITYSLEVPPGETGELDLTLWAESLEVGSSHMTEIYMYNNMIGSAMELTTTDLHMTVEYPEMDQYLMAEGGQGPETPYVELNWAPLLAETTVGDGTETGNHIPMEPYYGYTYSQVIYLQSEIEGSGVITDISYQYESSSGFGPDDIVIYMGHTSKSQFDSNSDWIDAGDMTEVYNGTFTVTPGSGDWVNITLDSPFTYNNVDNLVIAFDENTSGYHSSGDEFYCTEVTNPRALYYYSDWTNPDPMSPPSGSWGTPISYIANVKFNGSSSMMANNDGFSESRPMSRTTISDSRDIQSVGRDVRDIASESRRTNVAWNFDRSDADSIQIFRCDELIATVGADMDSYTDYDVEYRETYTYKIRKVYDGGEYYSQFISATAMPDRKEIDVVFNDVETGNGMLDLYFTPIEGDTTNYKTVQIVKLINNAVYEGYDVTVTPTDEPSWLVDLTQETVGTDDTVKLYMTIDTGLAAGVYTDTLMLMFDNSIAVKLQDDEDYETLVTQFEIPIELTVSSFFEPAEFTGDPSINAQDLLVFLHAWNGWYNPETGEHSQNWNASCDIGINDNGDYIQGSDYYIDEADLFIFAPYMFTNDGGTVLASSQSRSVEQSRGRSMSRTFTEKKNIGTFELAYHENVVEANEEFTVELRAKEITDLYGAKFNVKYDNDMLEVVSVDQGEFMKANGQTTFFKYDTDDENLSVTISKLGAVEAAKGDGVVAEITFNAKAAGTAQFVLSNVNACDGSYRGANATTLRGGKVDIRKHQVSAPTPDVYRLAQNYPNPFNPTTGISYDIPEKADVFIGVYNVTGQLVKTLVNEEQDAGYYKVEWNGTDEADNKVSSGVYFYRMITDEYSDVKRMTLLK